MGDHGAALPRDSGGYCPTLALVLLHHKEPGKSGALPNLGHVLLRMALYPILDPQQVNGRSFGPCVRGI